MFSSLALAVLGLPFVHATIWNVTVGAGGQLRYSPENITAAIGDVVSFTFNPKNHTVTQSAFDPPCVPLAGGGFNSGFHPVTATDITPSIFEVTVNDTSPIWVYCAQTGHCGEGMVFSINAPLPPSNHSFDSFQSLAIQQNGTATSATSTSASVYVTPPPPEIITVTDTVTLASSTYTTTYGSWEGSAAPTPAANPQNHLITVGDNSLLAYSATNITASIGDTVTFEFHPKNHTVTQSSFLEPCKALEGGFDSGFVPVNATTTDFPVFTITVNTTAPIWGYCRQTGHCGQGMVFAINAVANGPNNFTAFQGLAQQINGTSSSSSATTTSTGPSSSNTGGTSSAQSLMHPGSVGVGALVGVLTFVATGFALVL